MHFVHPVSTLTPLLAACFSLTNVTILNEKVDCDWHNSKIPLHFKSLHNYDLLSIKIKMSIKDVYPCFTLHPRDLHRSKSHSHDGKEQHYSLIMVTLHVINNWQRTGLDPFGSWTYWRQKKRRTDPVQFDGAGFEPNLTWVPGPGKTCATYYILHMTSNCVSVKSVQVIFLETSLQKRVLQIN